MVDDPEQTPAVGVEIPLGRIGHREESIRRGVGGAWRGTATLIEPEQSALVRRLPRHDRGRAGCNEDGEFLRLRRGAMTIRWRRGIRWLGTAAASATTLVVLLSGCGCSSATVSRAGTPRGAVVPVRVAIGPRGAVVVLAPVYVNGRGPFRFVLDTGASRSVIDQGLAKKLRFSIHPSHQALTGVNSTHAAGRINVSRWRIGNVSLPSGPVLTLPLASDQRGPGLGGLIGSDNLRRFGSFLLDYRRDELILHVQ